LLKLVDKEEGLSQKEIATQLNIQPPTVAVSIRRLEKSGWITRETDSKDKRISRVFITEAGRKIVNEVNYTINEMDKVVISGISEAELCLLRRILIQLIQNLRETIDEKEINKLMQKFKHHHYKKHNMCDDNDMKKGK
jgi:DNA-binding MarR family transcriptional regulator